MRDFATLLAQALFSPDFKPPAQPLWVALLKVPIGLAPQWIPA